MKGFTNAFTSAKLKGSETAAIEEAGCSKVGILRCSLTVFIAKLINGTLDG
jgi:hypothetical protein